LRRHQLAQMLIIGVIASAIGIAVALSINWFPVQASSQAKKIDDLWDVLLIASVPIFVPRRGRGPLQRCGNSACARARSSRTGRRSTATRCSRSSGPRSRPLIIFSLVTYAYIVLVGHREEAQQGDGRPGDRPAVRLELPIPEPGQPIVNTDTLYVPKGESVRFNIKATDVIHDFWVPAFRLKIDAVPGITTHYRVTPVRNGSYAVVCAELCGLGHSTMRSTVHVVDPVTFKGWLAAKRAAKPAGATS